MRSRIISNDFKGLNKFVKTISDDGVVKVGIFQKRAPRKEGSVTNPELGAIHEFGSYSKNIPARSFLRMPIYRKASQIIKWITKASKFTLLEGNKKELLVQIGIACEEQIQLAFDTQGFGSWAPNSYATVMAKLRRGGKKFANVFLRKQLTGEYLNEGAKGINSPLIDTGQLRRSISSKVGPPQ